MEVLLRLSVDKLGSQGDVVRVKPGYARNFLIPQGLAVLATNANRKQFEFQRKKLQKVEQDRKAKLREVAGSLKDFSLTFEVNANEEGKLFGAVTARMIQEQLAKAGFDSINVKQIEMSSPIKELGVFTVPLYFDAATGAEIKVWVVDRSAGNKEEDTAAGTETSEAQAETKDGEEAGTEEAAKI